MKEFSIAQDIGEYQLSCLVEYKDIAICPVGNVYMNTKCMGTYINKYYKKQYIFIITIL